MSNSTTLILPTPLTVEVDTPILPATLVPGVKPVYFRYSGL